MSFDPHPCVKPDYRVSLTYHHWHVNFINKWVNFKTPYYIGGWGGLAVMNILYLVHTHLLWETWLLDPYRINQCPTRQNVWHSTLQPHVSEILPLGKRYNLSSSWPWPLDLHPLCLGWPIIFFQHIFLWYTIQWVSILFIYRSQETPRDPPL